MNRHEAPNLNALSIAFESSGSTFAEAESTPFSHDRNVVACYVVRPIYLCRRRQILGAEGMRNTAGKEAQLVRADVNPTVGQSVQEKMLDLVK